MLHPISVHLWQLFSCRGWKIVIWKLQVDLAGIADHIPWLLRSLNNWEGKSLTQDLYGDVRRGKGRVGLQHGCHAGSAVPSTALFYPMYVYWVFEQILYFWDENSKNLPENSVSSGKEMESNDYYKKCMVTGFLVNIPYHNMGTGPTCHKHNLKLLVSFLVQLQTSSYEWTIQSLIINTLVNDRTFYFNNALMLWSNCLVYSSLRL